MSMEPKMTVEFTGFTAEELAQTAWMRGEDASKTTTNDILAMVAAAPLSPPSEFFNTPEPDSPTPMTYEDDGRVYGHPPPCASSHRGFMHGALAQCVTPT